MKKHRAVWLMAAALLSSLSAGSRVAATEEGGNATATDQRPGLATEFNAASPHPSLAGQADPVGPDRFVLETQDFGSAHNRWSANDIRPDSFVWRDEASSDGGKTWKLQAEYQMKRRGAASAAH